MTPLPERGRPARVRAVGFHVTNLLGHAINALLVFWLARVFPGLWGLKRPLLPAFLAGLFFAITAHHAEAVVWIAGRTDVFVTLFSLVSLLAYCHYLLGFKKKFLVISLVAFVFALTAKEMAITLPLMILILAFFTTPPQPPQHRHLLILPGLFMAIAGLYLISRYLVLETVVGGYGSSIHLKTDAMLLSANLATYSLKALTPHLIQPYLAALPGWLLSTVGIGEIVGVAGLFWLNTARHYVLPTLLLLFIVALLPVISLGVQITDMQGERFLYLPSVFISIAVGYGLVKVSKPVVFYSFCTLIVLCCLADLQTVNRRWTTAGQLAHQVITTLVSQARHDKILITNLPDHYQGAYVLRNGIRNALSVFGGGAQQVVFYATHSVADPADKVSVSYETTPAGTLFKIMLSENSRFIEIPRREPVVVQSVTPRELKFLWPASLENVSVFFYSHGQLLPLTPSTPPAPPLPLS